MSTVFLEETLQENTKIVSLLTQLRQYTDRLPAGLAIAQHEGVQTLYKQMKINLEGGNHVIHDFTKISVFHTQIRMNFVDCAAEGSTYHG